LHGDHITFANPEAFKKCSATIDLLFKLLVGQTPSFVDKDDSIWMLNCTPFNTAIERDVFPRTAFVVAISKLGGQARLKLSDCHVAILFLSQRS
jgi:hypothetical protein